MLVAAAGFEDRSLAVAQLLQNARVANATIIAYKPRDPRNRMQLLIEALRGKGFALPHVHSMEYDRFKPQTFADSLKTRLIELKTVRVILDISALSKLATLLCLDVTRELNLRVIIHYAEAQEYGPSRNEYEQARGEKVLSRPSTQIYTGVRGVIRVARFSSVAMQGQPTAAIAFMSFNEELIQALLDSVYPSRLFLINSRPPVLKWREQATAWIHSRLLNEWPAADNPIIDGVPVRTASTLDYRESIAVLRDLYWSLNIDHRILLAPTGSKMQTLACFLIVAIHPDIHVEYPTPHGFLNLYSKGTGTSWAVNLGKVGDLIARLSAEEQKAYLQVPSSGQTQDNSARR
ncbi:MAG: hypothetical protein QOI07_1915 [Verrucomicrobiota bacterium]